MEHYFFATLTAVLVLIDEEFYLLFDEAEHHYDFTVKESTKVGGFLYGIRNRRSFAMKSSERDHEVEFTESQLDLMMKALEMTTSTSGIKLRGRFLKIFKELQQKTVDVNKPLNNLKFVGQFTGK